MKNIFEKYLFNIFNILLKIKFSNKNFIKKIFLYVQHKKIKFKNKVMCFYVTLILKRT